MESSKWKTEAQGYSLIRLPFRHREKGILPFVDEETNGSYPFANGLNGLAHLCN